MLRCIVVQKISGTTFLKLRLNAMNSGDRSLDHLFIKFTVYTPFFRNKFVINYIFSMNMQSTLFSLSELLGTFYAIQTHLFSINIVQRTHFLIFQTFQKHFSYFTQNLIAVLCSILTPSTRRKNYLHQNNCNPLLHRRNKLKLAHHINKRSL
jgi:hypothetical protein